MCIIDLQKKTFIFNTYALSFVLAEKGQSACTHTRTLPALRPP